VFARLEKVFFSSFEARVANREHRLVIMVCMKGGQLVRGAYLFLGDEKGRNLRGAGSSVVIARLKLRRPCHVPTVPEMLHLSRVGKQRSIHFVGSHNVVGRSLGPRQLLNFPHKNFRNMVTTFTEFESLGVPAEELRLV
jgi:hypothetical protein